MEELITKICAACGQENDIVPKEPKQYNPKAILFICRFCRVRNLRDGTAIPLEKHKALPKTQTQEKPRLSLEKPKESSKFGSMIPVFGALIFGVIAVILHKKLRKPQGMGLGGSPEKSASSQIDPLGVIKK